MLRSRSILPPRTLWALLALTALLLTSCKGGGSGAERAVGSVLWVDGRSGPVSESDFQALASNGVREIFLQAAELSWEGGEPRLEVSWPGVPLPRTRVTLVIGGQAPRGEVGDVGARLADELTPLELDVQHRGGLPSGFHLHLVVPDEAALESLAALTAQLGSALGEERPLSVTLPRGLLDSEGASGVARAAGALVVFLYGQGAEGPEEPGLWDLQAVRQRLQRLEALGSDYLVGVTTLGRMTRKDRSGQPMDSTTIGSMRKLLDRQELQATLGSALAVVDGRVYDFTARGPLRVGPWRLAPRERLQIRLVGGSHLRRLREMLAEPEWERHLGQAYYRPPRAEEELAVPPGVLAGVLAPEPPPARIEVQREIGSRRGRAVIRLTVTNSGSESTEIAHVENNYVEMHTRRGRFVQVDRGDFQRYDLIDSASGRRSLRADTVRFFAPFLAAGETVQSGEVILAGGNDEDLVLGGSFLLPGGSTAEVVEAAPEGGGGDEPAGDPTQ